MLHEKWLVKFRLFPKRRLLKFIAERQPHQFRPNRKATEELLTELQLEWFTHYNPNVGASVNVLTYFPNMEALTKQVKELRILVQKERPIKPDWLWNDAKEISLDQFFIGNDHCYLNVHKAIEDYRKETLELCRLMEPSDTATMGLYEHNLRMLTKILISLQAITIKLIEVGMAKL
jgi:hypothetical protein